VRARLVGRLPLLHARQGGAGSHGKVVGSSKGDGEGRAGLVVELGFMGQSVRQSCRGCREVGQGRRAAVVSRGGLGLVIYRARRYGWAWRARQERRRHHQHRSMHNASVTP
jgi:hypothetical protein